MVQRSKLVEFLKDTDVLILDSQYTDEKYQEHIGWGHGALSRVVSLALEARAKKLFLFHHDPSHDDDKIDEMLERARASWWWRAAGSWRWKPRGKARRSG